LVVDKILDKFHQYMWSIDLYFDENNVIIFILGGKVYLGLTILILIQQ